MSSEKDSPTVGTAITERGDIDIPTPTLIKLANFHQVSVDYLLERTDNPKTNE